MAPTKVLNRSHGQALSFEFFKKNFVLYLTIILFNVIILYYKNVLFSPV